MYKSNNLDIHKNTIIESKNALFFQHTFPYINKEHESSSSLQIHENMASQEQKEESINEDKQIELRRSKRERTEKLFGYDFLT